MSVIKSHTHPIELLKTGLFIYKCMKLNTETLLKYCILQILTNKFCVMIPSEREFAFNSCSVCISKELTLFITRGETHTDQKRS